MERDPSITKADPSITKADPSPKTIRCVEFSGRRWYCIDDVAQRSGYEPYELKWARNYINITETRSEFDEQDPVKYVLECDLFRWLEWAEKLTPALVSLYQEIQKKRDPPQFEISDSNSNSN